VVVTYVQHCRTNFTKEKKNSGGNFYMKNIKIYIKNFINEKRIGRADGI
jgi:hypothetical protein